MRGSRASGCLGHGTAPLPEDQPLEAKMVSKSIERAQRQVESQNFEIRKNVLKYDEVMNSQRENVYEWRESILEGTAGEDLIDDWIDDDGHRHVEMHEFQRTRSDWDWEAIQRELGSSTRPRRLPVRRRRMTSTM
jgi:preprotein translocase subunit SecA